MTLQTLLQNLYRRLNYADSPDAAVTTRLTMFLNQRHRELMTSPGMSGLRHGFGNITTAAGQAEYALPNAISRLISVRDGQNDQVLGFMSMGVWRSVCPDPENLTGTPTAVVPIGMRAVSRRPAGAQVWAVSSAAGDTTQSITLHYSTTPGGGGTPAFIQQTTTALNGTTRVAVAAGAAVEDIFDISLSAACAGYVQLYDAAVSGNLLVTIPIGYRLSRLYAFALHPTPSAARDYDIDFEFDLLDLSNTWDEPRLPTAFHDVLIWAVLVDEYLHRDDSRLDAAEARYQKRLGELKAHLYNHRAALRRNPPSEVAPLGTGDQAGWYPRQTW